MLNVKSGDGSEYSSRVDIRDDEMATLIAFADSADELSAAGILQKDLRVHIEIKFDAEKGVQISGNMPDSDAVAALLHRVRPFVLVSEPMSYLSVRNILARRIDNPIMRQILE